jgi:phosphoribosyl 1,2-cyclic phosphodiesterase
MADLNTTTAPVLTAPPLLLADPGVPSPEEAQLPRSVPLAPPTQLQVKFWGTRGSIPVSGGDYSRYGGNTVCVSLTSDTGHLFIFDAGSGIRPLGVALQKAAKQPDGHPASGYLFLSHSHWDHIQGFPFFQPAFAPHAQLSIIGCSDRTQKLVDLLAGQQEWDYFPVPLSSLPAHLMFYAMCGGECRLDGAEIATLLQKHTLPSLAFRVKLGEWNVVYASDNEPLSPPVIGDHLLGYDVIDERLVDFARGADMLIHDSQYTPEEYPSRVGWGHNIPEVAVDTAIHAGVKRLVLFHHDPEHTDAQLDAMLARAQARARRLAGDKLEVISSHDGMEFTL